MPGGDVDPAGGYSGNGEATSAVWNCEVGVREHPDDRAHVRVQVTEDFHDAGLGEGARLRRVARVASKIEGGCTRERKHVVEDQVVVRKFDGRTGGDCDDV